VALALVGDFLGRLCASERGVVIEVLPYIAYACIRLWIPIAVKDETSVVRGFDAVQSLLGGVGQRRVPSERG